MENEYISRLNTLLLEEDMLSVSREVSKLKTEFDDWLLHSEGKQQVATLKAKELGEDIEQVDYTIIKESFYILFSKYKDAKKLQLDLKNKLEAENLKLKNSLISDLKNLVENEENIGTAFNGYNTIQDTWKKIGDIPRDKRDSIQKEYSRLRELFFHNITIYKELKEHDYKRNTQLKQKVIVKLQTLRNECEQIRELEKTLRIYQDEWEDVGPVQKEEWDGLKTSYWEVVRSIYDKINKHYEQHRASQQENLKKKQAVLGSLKAFLDGTTDIEGQKEWQKTTDEVLKFQADWKKIGFAPKKDNDAIWKEFRAACDSFFKRKKEHYKHRDNKDKDARDAKKALILEANELKSSEDWKEASHSLIQLQKKWKTLKSAGRYEKKLWEEFRGACDHFFNKKEETSKANEKQLTLNLAARKEFLASITKLKVSSVEDIKKVAEDFQKIGSVPTSALGGLLKEFNKVLKLQLEAANMSPNEIDLLLFKVKIDAGSSSQGSADQFAREKKSLRLKISDLEKDLIKAETNMGYFSVSKGSEKLFAQVNEKNDKIKEEIELLKRKIKMIPNE
tara:strand:- start:1062 stop:2750 length:1689 start_codon:yes stop_codon:yes gene_type:complete